MQIPKLICFDVGARNGLQDLKFFSGQISLFSFEPNISGNDTLVAKNNSYSSFEVIQKALYDKIGRFDFHMMANPSMSSLLMPDDNILNEYFNSIKEFKNWRQQLLIRDTKKIETTTIDEIVKEKNIEQIDYLKLDTQGTELAILQGAQNCLQEKKVLVIKTEFAFVSLYKDQPTFSEIDIFLKENGYKLITCEFNYGTQFPTGNENEKPKWGIGGDAYYCLDFEKIPGKQNDKMLKAAIIIGALGFLSNSDHLFNKLNISRVEQVNFYNKISKQNKKELAKYFLPPALIDLFKKMTSKKP